MSDEDKTEEELLRTVALRNANAIMLARLRAEEQLIAAKEALRESNERLTAIFNQAAVGIAMAELDGRLSEVNAKFCQILGYTPQKLRQMTFADITHPEDLAETWAHVRKLLAGEIADYVIEKRYLRQDGEIVWSLTSVTLLRDASGRPQRFIGAIEDITNRKRTEEALRAARAQAERASAMKDEFLATLSHELRTPLSAILGWAQVLRRGTHTPAELQQGLETIERNARAQTQLIEDLLDMSRITSGKLRLDIQPVEPVPFIDAAIEAVRPAAGAKGVRIEKKLDPAAGPVSGDASRLQQVVWNLLSNAVKFTRKGDTITIGLERVGSNVVITVTDTGVGIRPEFLPHVFERFRQADASSTRTFGGLGLGLAIVKDLVDLHGGQVHVHSAGHGQGTTFSVHLPVARARPSASGEMPYAAAPTPAAVEFELADLSGLRVLLVDDEADARDLIERVLGECNAHVLPAAGAEEALALLEREGADVLLTDIGMPGIDGYELLRRVRALPDPALRRIPAVALTAFARSEDRTRALRAGFLVHVAKPVEPSELVATVASVTGRTGAAYAE